MPPVRDDELRQAPAWPLGLNNTAEEKSLPLSAAGLPLAVREADNVDFDASGKVRRRAGYTLAAAGDRVHSGWSDPYLPWALYVDGPQIRAFHGDESTQAIVSGLSPGLPVSFVRVNDAVLWSNETECGAIRLDLESEAWACPTPAGQPTVEVLPGGALDAGVYQVAVTFIDARGRESGAARAVSVDVPAGSSLELTDIPQPDDPDQVPTIRVYLTTGNDGVLRAAARLPAGFHSLTLNQRPEGQPLETMHLRPMPPGQIVRQFAGRQIVGRGHELLFSAPLRYGLYNPARDRVGFAARVDLIEPVGDGGPGAGVFVADAKRTYFLPGGNPANWSNVIAYPTGAIPGTVARMSGEVWGLPTKEPVPVWVSRNGRICVGLPSGQVLTPETREGAPDALIDQAARGALLLRGKQVIAALQDTQPQGLVVRDRMIARVYRHEDPR